MNKKHTGTFCVVKKIRNVLRAYARSMYIYK